MRSPGPTPAQDLTGNPAAAPPDSCEEPGRVMPALRQDHEVSPRMEATGRRSEMHSSFRIVACWAVLATGAAAVPAAAAAAGEMPPAVNRGGRLLAADVQPILHTRCLRVPRSVRSDERASF